jgi:hypothetical protein
MPRWHHSAIEQLYCLGLLYERRAKAQMRAGRPTQALVPLFEEAMRHFAEAEKIRPPANDESILRWNRCVRLLESLPGVEQLDELHFDVGIAHRYPSAQCRVACGLDSGHDCNR